MEERARLFREAAAGQALGRSGRSMRYSESLRAEAISFVKEGLEHGLSVVSCSKLLSVSDKTLYDWLRKANGGNDLRRVEVSDAKDTDVVGVLVSPSGWRIEGLSMEALTTLLRLL